MIEFLKKFCNIYTKEYESFKKLTLSMSILVPETGNCVPRAYWGSFYMRCAFFRVIPTR